MRVLLTTLAAMLALAAPASAASPDVVISQVYGGGGNLGAPYTNDFIELFNRGQAAVSLKDMSVQYASATGSGNIGANAGQLTELPDVMLEAGQYFLVHEAAGTTPSASLPANDAPDASPIAMAAGAGKLALVRGVAGLGCNGGSTACSAEQLARVVDLVGYGGANFFEGAGAAPALTNGTSAARKANGCQDTNSNATDFAVADPPAPRNSATQPAPCAADAAPSVASSNPLGNAVDVPLDANVTLTFSEPVDADASAFSLTCADSGAHALAVSGGPVTFTLDPDSSFARGEACTVTVEAGSVRDQDLDDPPDAMAADAAIAFTTVAQERRIREIQGESHLSPLANRLVSHVPGVVTARRLSGFFMQDAEPDGDASTSEGIFVFTGAAPPAGVVVGKAVRVSGRVSEFRPSNRPADLTLTEIVQPTVTVTGDGAEITPTLIGAGGLVPPGRIIDNDSLGDVELSSLFDPDEDGIDFYERLEGMLVRVNSPLAVGPTAAPNIGELPIVADDGLFAGPRTARGGLLVTPDDFNPERMHLDDEVLKALPTPAQMPAADVRDHLSDVEAVVDYSFSNFKLQVTSAPAVTDGGLEKETTEAPGPHELAVGSFNVENLTPLGSNPSPAQIAKYRALAETLVVRMQAPDLVAVEEIQDNDGTAGGTNSPVTDASQTWASLIDAIESAGGPRYEYRQIDPVAHQDGGAPGGNIRVGFLFRTDRGLEFVDRPGGTATDATGIVDTPHGARLTLSPGRIEPNDPAWTASRKPLAGEFRWRGRTLIAVANHFASKSGDDPLFGHFQPPVRHTENGPDGRHRQAALVNQFARELLAADNQARLIVLGDINDFDFSETVNILESGGVMTSLFEMLPEDERYSYVFEGNSQVLDQILVSPTLMHPAPEYDSVHMNAEFTDQTSDHDPQVARLDVTGRGH